MKGVFSAWSLPPKTLNQVHSRITSLWQPGGLLGGGGPLALRPWVFPGVPFPRPFSFFSLYTDGLEKKSYG